jgi:hypothetical protein
LKQNYAHQLLKISELHETELSKDETGIFFHEENLNQAPISFFCFSSWQLKCVKPQLKISTRAFYHEKLNQLLANGALRFWLLAIHNPANSQQLTANSYFCTTTFCCCTAPFNSV